VLCAVDIIFGSGTVIARQDHSHLRHDGPFETCRLCQRHHLIWTPSTDFGIVVHTANGRLAESALEVRLLAP
jgi:hypothetical protein